VKLKELLELSKQALADLSQELSEEARETVKAFLSRSLSGKEFFSRLTGRSGKRSVLRPSPKPFASPFSFRRKTLKQPIQ